MFPKDQITIKNLSVGYDGHLVLEGFNAQIPSGQITALIGHNGSGKSTLLKALAGILSYRGEIDFFGGVSQDKLEIGYVPQRFEADFSLPISVNELLWLSLAVCHLGHKDKRDSIKNSLKKVGLPNFGPRTLNSLSGGQLQRVLLARAIVHQPRLLLLDEPESGMDAASERAFYELLRELVGSENYTVVLASHNLETVSAFADQVIDLHELSMKVEV